MQFALPRTPRLELWVGLDAAMHFVIGPRDGGDSGVFNEDAPCLPDHRGLVQANVMAVEEQLGGGTFQVRARVGDDPIGGAGTGRVAKVRDDRMRADRRINPQVAERDQERVPGGELADARREFAPESGSEQVWLVAR